MTSPAASRRRGCLAALAILVATGAADLEAAEPALALLRLGTTAEVFVGSRPEGGDPMQPPVFTWRASGGAADEWSALHRLEPMTLGLPVALRGTPWRLETAGFSRGHLLHHRLLPLTGELGLVGGRLEALENVARVRVASMDDWTIALAEQAADGTMLLRRITAEGPALELEVREEGAWPTGWPAPTEMISFDADAGRMVAFGRESAVSGPAIVHVATMPEENLPPLSVEASALVAGALLADGPAVASLASGLLRLHVLGAAGWDLRGEAQWPAGAPASVLTLGAGNETRTLAVVAGTGPVPTDGGPSVTILTHDGRAFSAPISTARRVDAPPPVERLAPAHAAGGEPEATDGALPPRLMLVGAALTALAALAVLVAQMRALRRRRDAAPR